MTRRQRARSSYSIYVAGVVLLFLLAVGVGVTAAVVGDRRAASGSGETGVSEGSKPETTGPTEATGGEQARGTAHGGTVREAPLFYRATDENSSGDYMYIDNPSIHGDPNAVIIATPTPDQVGAGTYPHNIGVWYEGGRRKWAIFNQNRVRVPEGSTFEVVIPQESASFVHYANPANTARDYTYIDDPSINGRPDIIPSLTQNWNPGGGRGIYNDHPVDLVYDANVRQWAIYNQDGARIPRGAAFNVAVPPDASAR